MIANASDAYSYNSSEGINIPIDVNFVYPIKVEEVTGLSFGTLMYDKAAAPVIIEAETGNVTGNAQIHINGAHRASIKFDNGVLYRNYTLLLPDNEHPVALTADVGNTTITCGTVSDFTQYRSDISSTTFYVGGTFNFDAEDGQDLMSVRCQGNINVTLVYNTN